MFLTQERRCQLVKRIGTLDMRAMPTSLKHLYRASSQIMKKIAWQTLRLAMPICKHCTSAIL